MIPKRETFIGIFILLWLTVILPVSAISAEPDAGRQFRLVTASIRFALSASLSSANSPALSTVKDPISVVETSASRWSAVSALRITFTKSNLVSVSSGGVRGDGVSLITIAATAENLALFPDNEKSPPAVTRIFFNKAGFITEADIVLNPFVRFSDNGETGYDLETVLTHEIGHAVGLGHSYVPSSIMNSEIESADYWTREVFPGRQLAQVDISSIRAKYGPKELNEDCCSAIIGSVYSIENRPLSAEIWVEDEAGRLIAYTRSQPDGFFSLKGLESGIYSVYAQFPEQGFAAKSIVNRRRLLSGDILELNTRLSLSKNLPIIRYFGFNSGLSRRPAVLSGAKQGQMFLFGEGIGPNDFEAGFSTGQIIAFGNEAFSVDFGLNIPAVAVPFSKFQDDKTGEFSFFVQNSKSERVYCIGCIKIVSEQEVDSAIVK